MSGLRHPLLPRELSVLLLQSVPSLEHQGNFALDTLDFDNLGESHVPTGCIVGKQKAVYGMIIISR